MKKTKKEMVEEHLITNGSITSLEAIVEYWATRLSAIIYNLKEEGWQFDTTKEKHHTGATYARYHLKNLPVGYNQTNNAP